MKSTVTSIVALSVWMVFASVVFSQDATEDEAEAKPARKRTKIVEEDKPIDPKNLPSPLDVIRTNIFDLERSGYFAVEDVALRTRGTGDDAVIWTIRIRKPVTCRHVESMLREYRDARFYRTLENQTVLVFATLAHYSKRVSTGASNGGLLRKDDVFEIWIDLPTKDFGRLKSLDVDTLVLRRWKY